MSKISYMGITDKWGFWHTCYVVPAAQNIKEFRHSSIWTCSHIIVILRSQHKNTDFLMILARLCRFNFILYYHVIKVVMSIYIPWELKCQWYVSFTLIAGVSNTI